MKRRSLPLTLPTLAVSAALAFPQASGSDEPDSADILDAIERELRHDHAVQVDAIDVAVRSGVVTLEGSVDNMLAMERAARIAETVKGVRAVVNQVDVEPDEERSHADLVADVSAALLTDPATDAYEVTVQAHDGHVALSGTVDSWRERELCSQVAKGVRGVRELTNEIEVEYRDDRLDSEIQADIEQTMHWDVLVDDDLVDVAVQDGVVTLTGVVGSAAEKRRARYDAWASGVRSVDDSQLAVARWARDEDLRKSKYAQVDDATTEKAVAAAMAVDPRVYSFNVTADARQGVVTLRGLVDNLKAKRAAEQNAWNTVGVVSVRNHLKVRPAEERESSAIQADVSASLVRNPIVDRYEIAVGVDDGVVILRGSVDSYFERGLADELAARVEGVTQVVNHLTVENPDRPAPYDPNVDEWRIDGYAWYRPLPPARPGADWLIERNIRDELYWSPFVDSDEISIEVEDGIATLSGSVDSWAERGAAHDNAYEGGATYVRNRITVTAGAAAAQ